MKQSRSTSVKKRRPATTPEAREQQLISAAFDLVEQRILDGTATSQETTTILKLGSEKAKLEKEILVMQKELMSAKTDALKSAKHIEEMYAEALTAMRHYSGNYDEPDESTVL